jgi:hypothetical protein
MPRKINRGYGSNNTTTIDGVSATPSGTTIVNSNGDPEFSLAANGQVQALTTTIVASNFSLGLGASNDLQSNSDGKIIAGRTWQTMLNVLAAKRTSSDDFTVQTSTCVFTFVTRRSPIIDCFIRIQNGATGRTRFELRLTQMVLGTLGSTDTTTAYANSTMKDTLNTAYASHTAIVESVGLTNGSRDLTIYAAPGVTFAATRSYDFRFQLVLQR